MKMISSVDLQFLKTEWTWQSSMISLAGVILISHYSDVMMDVMTSQITDFSMVCSIVCSGEDQRKHQSSASLAFVRGIHRWPENSPHKRSVTWKMFPFDDAIILSTDWTWQSSMISVAAAILVWVRCSALQVRYRIIELNLIVWHAKRKEIKILSHHLWPLLLTWFNFNPSMDK